MHVLRKERKSRIGKKSPEELRALEEGWGLWKGHGTQCVVGKTGKFLGVMLTFYWKLVQSVNNTIIAANTHWHCSQCLTHSNSFNICSHLDYCS